MIEKTFELGASALRFHTFKTDKFKMSRLSFNFILPADSERSPVTRLMLSTMIRGCEKYPTIVKINKRLDELYGAMVNFGSNSVGERHIFKISAEFLSDRFRLSSDTESVVKGVCEVILEILFNPLKDENGLLSKSNFESEKKLAIDNIKSLKNNQRAYAAKQCASVLFEGHPAGISTRGTIEQVEKITIEDVSKNIEYFLKNSVIECYYVGNDDISEVVELVDSKFSLLNRDKRELFGKVSPILREKDVEIRMREETMNVSQCRLNLGLTCDTVIGTPGHSAMVVFNEIFGGSSVSKLFMNIREKMAIFFNLVSTIQGKGIPTAYVIQKQLMEHT